MTKIEMRKLEAEIKRLRKLAYYDELTGVLNRHGFKMKAEEVFEVFHFRKVGGEKRAPARMPFSVIFIDLDDFKKINDAYGHGTGDLVLKHAAKALKRVMRKSDIFGRWGGEEFVIALPDIAKETAGKVAEKLRRKIEATEVKFGRKKISVTASIGIASYHGEKTLYKMIEKAGKAMYKAKKSGKNRVIVFNSY